MYRQLAPMETPPAPEEGWGWMTKNPRMSMAVHDSVALLGCPWAGQIHVFKMEGDKAESQGIIDLTEVRDMAFDPRGRFYVAAGSNLYRYDQPRPLEGTLGPSVTLALDQMDVPGDQS